MEGGSVMSGIYIRIAVSSAPKGGHANGHMITDRTGADLLEHRVRVYQCDGDALLSVIRGEGELWLVRVNGSLVESPDRNPIKLHAGDDIEIDHDGPEARRTSVPVSAAWRGVWTYIIAEIGPVDSAECAVAGLRHLLAGNVNTDAIPFIERALAELLGRRGTDKQFAPIRALRAEPPPCVSEIRIIQRGGGDATAVVFGTHRDEQGRRRYLHFDVWPDYESEAADNGKLVFSRFGEGNRTRLVDPSEVAALVEANAEWLAGKDVAP